MKRVLIVDWRDIEDFSAVGQLTKKIFISKYFNHCEIVHVRVNAFDKSKSVTVSVYKGIDKVRSVIIHNASYDCAIRELKMLDITSMYFRLSPIRCVLEFMVICLNRIRSELTFAHYMDKPSLKDMTLSQSYYIQNLYAYLINNTSHSLVMDSSIIQEFEEMMGIKPVALGNYIVETSFEKYIVKNISNKPIRIHYYGSIDRKMNEKALASILKQISYKPWIHFHIWSNSGIYGEIKEIYNESKNIFIEPSNLSDEEYKSSISESDALVIAYNSDEISQDFLAHSFSNKLIDYVSASRPIIYLGPKEIPTACFLEKHKIGVRMYESTQVIENLASKDALVDQLNSALPSIESYEKIKRDKLNDLIVFSSLIEGARVTKKSNEKNIEVNFRAQELGLLIRFKFLDNELSRQSLSSSLMADIVKRKGYKGFNCEI